MFNRLYVDDIFALFSFPDHADKFKEYVSTGHPSIIISLEKKKDDCLPSSGFKTFSKNEKLPTNVYRKITFSGVYPSFKRFILKLNKLVYLSHHYLGVSVYPLNLSNFIMRLINSKLFSRKTTTGVTWLTNALKRF